MAKDNRFSLSDWEASGQVVVGFDVGDQECRVRAVDEAGELREGWVKTEQAALQASFGCGPRALVVMESGSQVTWLTTVLKEMGHRVQVVDPVQAAAFRPQPWSKTDAGDAWTLAEMGWMSLARPGWVRTVWQRTLKNRRELALLRLRENLVEARTKLGNALRSSLKEVGTRTKKRDARTAVNRLPQELGAEDLELIAPMLAALEALSTAISAYEKKVNQVVEEEYAAVSEQLREVDSVGPVMTAALVLSITTPGRFKDSRAVGAYYGLTPAKQQSGERDPQLNISKRGDKLVRRVAVQVAQRILGPKGKDCELRRWGLAKAGDGQNKAQKKRAVIAVARKLVVLLHHLWVSGARYDPFYEANRQQGGVPLSG